MEPKRRHLPVVRDPSTGGAEDPPRQPWQWVVFGALAVFAVWVPVAAFTTQVVLVAGGLESSPFPRAALFGAGLAVASGAGGFLVGHWGTRGVGMREAALAGLAAALLGAAIAWREGVAGASVASVLVVVAVPAAALGGRLGLSWRR